MAKDQLPTSLPGGLMLPHMSARRRHEICDVVFEMLGGTERLHAVADGDPKWFYGTLWQKGLPRAVATEHAVTEGVEVLLDKLDAAERAKTIEGTFSEVVHAAQK